jgi:hypothetical protein
MNNMVCVRRARHSHLTEKADRRHPRVFVEEKGIFDCFEATLSSTLNNEGRG